jgi:SAM-dependent methyltransferase
VLVDELDLHGTGRLLDVGCGPGIVALRLAHLFDEVVGLDPDPEMLSEARTAAEGAAARNVRWVNARAEDLPGAAPGPYRLITFGQSFHWTDEHFVAETVFDLLERGGALALIAHTVDGRPIPDSRGYPPIPHEEIQDIVARYLGPRKRVGQGFAPTRDHRFEDVLRTTRFGEPRTVFAPGVPDVVRDTESVLSGYLSMATSAPHLFGNDIDQFAAEIRTLLERRSPEGLFWDWPGDTEIVLATKPAAPR